MTCIPISEENSLKVKTTEDIKIATTKHKQLYQLFYTAIQKKT